MLSHGYVVDEDNNVRIIAQLADRVPHKQIRVLVAAVQSVLRKGLIKRLSNRTCKATFSYQSFLTHLPIGHQPAVQVVWIDERTINSNSKRRQCHRCTLVLLCPSNVQLVTRDNRPKKKISIRKGARRIDEHFGAQKMAVMNRCIWVCGHH